MLIHKLIEFMLSFAVETMLMKRLGFYFSAWRISPIDTGYFVSNEYFGDWIESSEWMFDFENS